MDLEIDVVNEVEGGDNLDRVWERWDGGRYAIKEGNGQLGLLGFERVNKEREGKKEKRNISQPLI